ncbi:3-hydroxyacyl-ACP dehydratase FabZ [Tichowtungia aerotolerans]|uniref:3-hydroxyacyl-[acyl-carrier-protein] dehydratase FabZ n=1 Tax=Tichowtungia aerotolerans TaxID=2697043 RepID=A0A6P1M9X1_9BACT|nr:3-hydroxyacyl-ACP dehydratase FabZ [Tichowtungia aerotolerans]QHI68888.1 3-hydroxyacyl-ACP dehydratase FabZ [Tichowtungia aerotolerans]
MPTLEASEILKILPHRYPFMLVDRIIECDDEKRIVGIKNLTFNELFFQGHFPGQPVMPGVLQMEAMAQVAGILLNRMFGGEGKISYFAAIDNARFRRPVVPGDQLRMEIEIIKAKPRLSKVHAKAFVDDQLASSADLMFSSAG